MRTFLGVLLALTCLGLASCSLSGKKPAKKDAPRPFLGAEPDPSASTASAGRGEVNALATSTREALPGANGVLAGRVVDRYYRHSNKVLIQVEDLQDIKQAAAKLEVQSDDEGYFVIPNLTLGHQYRLIARSQDNGRLLSGSTVARPPLPNLTIFVSEDNTSPATPPLPESTLPTRPGRGDTPSGSLDPPVKGKPDEGESSKPGKERGTSSSTGTGASQAAPPAPDPSNVVDGFRRLPGSDATVNVPGPSTSPQPKFSVPPPPAWSPVTPPAPPAPAPPPPPPSVGVTPMVHIPSGAMLVPSCSLVGDRLNTFTLRDLRDQEWDFRRDHRGKLVLIDFWYTTCPPCIEAIGHLKQLQEEYGSQGLQIVGIACEREVSNDGQPITPREQKENVAYFCQRKGVPYQVLMSYGRDCPVRTQFFVSSYPSLFLYEEASGKLIWKSVGLGSDRLEDLRHLISTRLGVPYQPLRTR